MEMKKGTSTITYKFRLYCEKSQWLYETKDIYNLILKFYYEILQKEPDLYHIPKHKLLRQMELLTVGKKGQAKEDIKYQLPYKKVPLYFRRAAINDAIQKSVIIPKPINKDAVRESFLGERKKEIVAVGRLIPEKNYPLLIRTFKKVSGKFPDYKLIIYGEGSLRKELEYYIKNLGLTDKVILPGEKDDIFDRIYQSKLYVMVSNHEGMPIP